MYCKYKNTQDGNVWRCVLIVAKCIVNLKILIFIFFNNNVLIVAKCIVNKKKSIGDGKNDSINSSKVYCK